VSERAWDTFWIYLFGLVVGLVVGWIVFGWLLD
jgi:glycerol uptake facilitator-like aquaporin